MQDKDSDGHFDIRKVNLLRISKAIDLKLVIAQCEHVIADIDDQLATPGFGGADWRADAHVAKGEFVRIRDLARMKLDAIEAERADRGPDANQRLTKTFALKFLEAAKQVLPDEQYALVFDTAALMVSNQSKLAA